MLPAWRSLREGIQRLPEEPRQTLTVDPGLEMAAHTSFTIATNVQASLCDPRSPRQRGSNENINGLLRQYLLRRSHLEAFTRADLDAFARRLDTRPRKRRPCGLRAICSRKPALRPPLGSACTA